MRMTSVFGAACGILSLSRLALSQVALDRYEPAAPGSLLFSGSDAAAHEVATLQFAERVSYARSPLVLRATSAAQGVEVARVVQDELALHTQVAYGFGRWLSLDLDLPLVAQFGRAAPRELLLLEDPSGLALADVRLGASSELLQQGPGAPSVGLRGEAWLPTGSATHLTGSGEVRYGLMLLVGADQHPVAWRLGIGRRRQPTSRELQGVLSSDTNFFAGVRYSVGAFSFGPELFGSTFLSAHGNWFAKRATNLELLFDGVYARGPWRLGFGLGPGLTQAPGTPAFRALLSAELAFEGARVDGRSSAVRPALGSAPAQPKPGPDYSPTVGTAQPASSTGGPDTDGDGIEDARDLCPRVIGVEQPKTPGCPADRDGDGVTDTLDRCPSEAGIATDDPTHNGCPADSDGDGIPDGVDGCPHEQGARSADPVVNGCPSAVRVQGAQIVLLEQMNFATGKDTIEESSFGVLAQVAQILQQHPEIVRVGVDGHTDNVGAEARNLALSRRRAVAVVRWLIEHGVDERRLEARGFGPRRPIADTLTEAGRAKNRRVEFQILKRADAGEKARKDGSLGE